MNKAAQRIWAYWLYFTLSKKDNLFSIYKVNLLALYVSHSFKKYVLSTNYVPGTFLRCLDSRASMNKAVKAPALMELTF